MWPSKRTSANTQHTRTCTRASERLCHVHANLHATCTMQKVHDAAGSMCLHAHAHAHTHTHTHTHTRTHTHTLISFMHHMKSGHRGHQGVVAPSRSQEPCCSRAPLPGLGGLAGDRARHAHARMHARTHACTCAPAHTTCGALLLVRC